MKDIKKEILDIIREEVGSYIVNNLRKKKHRCLFCGAWFNARRNDNFFCNRNHYQRYHRIPGFIRKLLKHED